MLHPVCLSHRKQLGHLDRVYGTRIGDSQKKQIVAGQWRKKTRIRSAFSSSDSSQPGLKAHTPEVDSGSETSRWEKPSHSL